MVLSYKIAEQLNFFKLFNHLNLQI